MDKWKDGWFPESQKDIDEIKENIKDILTHYHTMTQIPRRKSRTEVWRSYCEEVNDTPTDIGTASFKQAMESIEECASQGIYLFQINDMPATWENICKLYNIPEEKTGVGTKLK